MVVLLPFWNRRERRLRALWRLMLTILLFLFTGATLTAMLGVVLGIEVLTLIVPPLSLLITVAAVTMVIVTLLVLWVAGRWLDRRRLVDFGLQLNRQWWLDFAFGLVLGAMLMGFIFVVELAAGWITITALWQQPDLDQPFVVAWLPPLITMIGVGIYEELMFRGYVLRNLSEGLNFSLIGARWAIVLASLGSSILFGLAHASNPNATVISTANIMLAGLFLALGYVLTGQLAMPIGIHITWNFFQGYVFGFPVSGQQLFGVTALAIEQGGPPFWTGGAFGPEAGLIGIIAMILGCVFTSAWVYWGYGNVVLRTTLAEYRLQ
ncbi:MAG: CPBP family intramembrane metalloprotease [Chloroflexaceae bacterium]|nr:CPBP family intramembrane metalloprotease [Chloroflexaceae bacterium]